MTDNELDLLKGMIDGLKADYKGDIAELKQTMADTKKDVKEQLCNFIKNHAKTCFFLIWQKGRWRKVGRVLAVSGLLLASPAFVLGVAEIVKLIVR